MKYFSKNTVGKSILVCKTPGCHNVSQDIRDNPNAWNEWQVTPVDVCPACISEKIGRMPKIRTSTSGGKVIRTLGPIT